MSEPMTDKLMKQIEASGMGKHPRIVEMLATIRRLREENAEFDRLGFVALSIERDAARAKYEEARELLKEAEDHDTHAGCRWMERVRAHLDGEET